MSMFFCNFATQNHITIQNLCQKLVVFNTFEMMEGDLPNRAQKMVKEWLNEHKDELQEMWETQKIFKLPPLKD